MARLVFDEQRRLLDWAGACLDTEFGDEARAIGLEGPNGLRAVSVFNHFTEGDCQIHIATTNTGFAMTLPFIRASFIFPFVQLRQRRLTGLVQASNERALRFDLKLGFKIEGRQRETHENDDTILVGMLRRECRFIPHEARDWKGSPHG